MKWSNLKNNRCPKDNSYLSVDGRFAKCNCGFIINLEKLGKIATEQVLQEIERRKEAVKQIEEEERIAHFEHNERRFNQ